MQNVVNLIIVLLYLVAVWDDFCLNISVNPLVCLKYPTKYKHAWIHETSKYKTGRSKAVSETEFIPSFNKYCKLTALVVEIPWTKTGVKKKYTVSFLIAGLSED